MIFAIDPGNIQSAYCVIDEDQDEYIFLDFGKLPNKDAMNKMLFFLTNNSVDAVVIERIASYGMAVGREVFETCEWIGRFAQEAEKITDVEYIYRREEKMTICGDMRAKDANIRMALIDRFAKFDFKAGKGTKKNPDVFYGMAADMWAACAVGVTYLDKVRKRSDISWL